MSVVLRVRRADGPHCEVGVDRAEVSRGRSTGRGSRSVVGKDRTSSGVAESVLLVPVAVIAAIPHRAGPLREQTVSSVEDRGGA